MHTWACLDGIDSVYRELRILTALAIHVKHGFRDQRTGQAPRPWEPGDNGEQVGGIFEQGLFPSERSSEERSSVNVAKPEAMYIPKPTKMPIEFRFKPKPMQKRRPKYQLGKHPNINTLEGAKFQQNMESVRR
jgi:hypothetical protein